MWVMGWDSSLEPRRAPIVFAGFFPWTRLGPDDGLGAGSLRMGLAVSVSGVGCFTVAGSFSSFSGDWLRGEDGMEAEAGVFDLENVR